MLAAPRLILTLENGDELAIPNATNLQFILYADFKEAQVRLKEFEMMQREMDEAKAQEDLKETLYQEHLSLLELKNSQLNDVIPIQKQA